MEVLRLGNENWALDYSSRASLLRCNREESPSDWGGGVLAYVDRPGLNCYSPAEMVVGREATLTGRPALFLCLFLLLCFASLALLYSRWQAREGACF